MFEQQPWNALCFAQHYNTCYHKADAELEQVAS